MNDILRDLGCSKKEIDIYLILLRFGISSVSEISRGVNLPRQTVYYLLESLVEKKIIEQTDKRGVRQFIADPFKIKSLIDNKKHDLELSKKKLDVEIVKMMSEISSKVEAPKVQFYQGREGLKRLLVSILDIYKRGKYKIFRGYAINEFYPGMEEFLDNFVKERYKLAVESLLFIPKKTDFSKIGGGQDTYGRKFKVLDIDYHEAAFHIVGNRLYLFSYKDNVGIMIENANLANLFKDIFDSQWNNTR